MAGADKKIMIGDSLSRPNLTKEFVENGEIEVLVKEVKKDAIAIKGAENAKQSESKNKRAKK